MADRNLTFRVGAQDDASTTLAKIAQASKREMGKVQKDLDETATNGQKMARILGSMAEELDTEFKRTEQAAERLGNALGPELRAKVDPDALIADFRRAGLTFDEIEQDAYALADGIRKIEQVSERAGVAMNNGLDDGERALNRTRDAADQSRSVIANMAGNATSELPGIGTALGPVNVAMGQLAEYAADGNIKLKNIVALGAGMAGLGLALKGITDHMARIAESDALREERVDAYTQAIREGESATGQLRDVLKETGQLMVAFGEAGTGDVAPVIDGLGLSIDQFSQLAGKSEEEIRAWARAMADAGADTGALTIAEAALLSTHNDLETAEERAAVTTRLLGDATGATAEEMQAAADAADRYREALEAKNAAEDAALGNQISLAEATLNTADALDEYRLTLLDAEASDRDKERAGLDLISTMQQEAEAAGRSAEDQAIASGNAAGAQAANVAAQIESLSRLAQNLAPGSQVRRMIDDHVMALLNIPTTIDTQVRVNPNYGQGTTPLGNRGKRAAGGPTARGGLYEVNENGSELLYEGGKTYLMAGQDGRVEPVTQAGGSMRGGGGGITVNVTAGFGADGDDIANKIVDLLTRWQRSNGSLPWAS